MEAKIATLISHPNAKDINILPIGGEHSSYQDFEDLVKNRVKYIFYPILHSSQKKDGGRRIWGVGIDVKRMELVTFSGCAKEGSKMIISTRAIKENKSGRNIIEQAFLELNSKMNTKIKKDGFVCDCSDGQLCFSPQHTDCSVEYPSIEQVKEEQPYPMLAESYDKIKQPIKYPILTQPKLDGVRCLAWLDKTGQLNLTSRGRNKFEHLNFIFENWGIVDILHNLPPNTVIDGEIVVYGDYGRGENFTAAVSIVRKVKTPLTKYEVESINYNIFTCFVGFVDKTPPLERHRILARAMENCKENLSDHIKLIPFTKSNSESETMAIYQQYLNEGHEGLMIYMPNGFYQSGKRSKDLIKLKPFDEKEGVIVDVIHGEGRESHAALFVVDVNHDGKILVTMHPMGSIESREELYKNKAKIIGKLITFKYQGLTPDGFPRFPVAREFRDYE